MGTLKTIHVACAALSFAGFFIRGVWMLGDSALLKRRWVKISPQVVDTVLLVSAIALAVQLHLSPIGQPWLMAKIVALVVYIGFGLVALRFGKTKTTRTVAWLLGMVVFAYIVSVAVSKSVLGWFAFV